MEREEREESRDSLEHRAPTDFLAPRAPQDHKGCLDPPMVYQEILAHRDPQENLDPLVPRGPGRRSGLHTVGEDDLSLLLWNYTGVQWKGWRKLVC